jgi:hypothetical protein
MSTERKDFKKIAIDFFNSDRSITAGSLATKLINEYGAPNAPTFYRTVRKWIASERSRDYRMNDHDALQSECEAVGIPAEDVKNYWYKGKNFSINVKNNSTRTIEDVLNGIIENMINHSPVYEPIKRTPVTDPHLLVVDPADVHIGKLCSAFETGESYDNQIAVKRVKDGVQGILDKSQGFNIEQILYIVGNDKLHVDTPKNTTTAGTHQDTTGMWYDNYMIGFQLDVDIIESLRLIAPVHVQYDPSNHDYTNGFFLAQALSAWFKNCEDVTFNVSIAHRKYYTYGQNLIGTTHGDGAKTTDLPLLMAQEASEHWHKCKHRYVYIHHIHHKMSKDYGSVCVESLRSPSGTDSWHSRNGYAHSPKAIEGFIHHPEHGQIARITHLF